MSGKDENADTVITQGDFGVHLVFAMPDQEFVGSELPGVRRGLVALNTLI